MNLPTLSGTPRRRWTRRWDHPVTVRMASAEDAEAIRVLAERDSRPVPPAPRLVAERCGRIEAALSLRTDEVVADPFRRTAELVELLRWARA